MEIVEQTLTDRNFYALLLIIFLLIQFAYNVWDKSKSNIIVEKLDSVAKAITEKVDARVDDLAPHLKRSERMFGILKELSEMHRKSDTDGRPMWYMPREMLDMQREIIAINHKVVDILENQKTALEKHSEACQAQFKESQKQN